MFAERSEKSSLSFILFDLTLGADLTHIAYDCLACSGLIPISAKCKFFIFQIWIAVCAAFVGKFSTTDRPIGSMSSDIHRQVHTNAHAARKCPSASSTTLDMRPFIAIRQFSCRVV